MHQAKKLALHPLTWLAILLALFFYKEVFLGRVFSPADQLYDFQPWSTQRPATYHGPSNAVRSDESLFGFPRRVQAVRDIQKFGLTLWQDHTFAGTANTLSAHYLGAFVYPPMLASLFLPEGLATTVLHLSVPLTAALCMYALLTRISREPLVRLFGSVVWALNGYVIVWLSAFTFPLTLITLPLLIYLADRFLSERKATLGLGYALLLGATFFLAYPPANIIVVGLLGIFIVSRLLLGGQKHVRTALALAGLTGLGLGIGGLAILTDATQLLPVASGQYRGALPPLPIRNLQTFLFPNVYGSPVVRDWRGPGNYSENIAYVGIASVVLALAGVFLAIERRAVKEPLLVAAAVIGLLSTLLAYRIWPAPLVEVVPALGAVRPARWQIGIVFSAVILAVYALDALARRSIRWPTLAAAVGLVAVAMLVLLAVHRHDFGRADAFITRDYALRVLVLVAVGGLALGPFLVRRPRLALLLLNLALVVDLFSFGIDFNPAIRPADFYPSTPAIRYLQAHASGYRVVAALRGGGLWPGDVLNVYGIDSLAAYDHFRSDRFVALLGGNVTAEERNFWRLYGYLILGQSLHLEDPVFDELNVKYAFYPNDRPETLVPTVPGWRVVYSGVDGRVLENERVLPKQFVIREGGAPEAVDHVPVAPDHDRLTVNGPGLLVWSKPYGSDWQVTNNGRAVKAVEYASYFLAVQLPSGSNQVALAYRPAVYYLGGLVSAASLLVLAALFVVLRRRSAKGSGGDHKLVREDRRAEPADSMGEPGDGDRGIERDRAGQVKRSDGEPSIG